MVMEFSTRGIAKIVEGAGVDFVLIDMEHSGFHIGAVNDLLAWFKATPVTPIVRVPAHDYDFIARVMDAGAAGIMAPNVRTPEEARAVNNAMRYAPEGGRGLGLGGSHNDYLPPDPTAYMREANQNNVILAQIESTTALENLDAIAATPGIDVLWIGHFDLTQSMGIVGQFDHPDFQKAHPRRSRSRQAPRQGGRHPARQSRAGPRLDGGGLQRDFLQRRPRRSIATPCGRRSNRSARSRRFPLTSSLRQSLDSPPGQAADGVPHPPAGPQFGFVFRMPC